MNRTHTFQVIGSREKADLMIGDKLSKAKEVKNTFLDLSNEDAATNNAVTEGYASWLKNDSPRTWEDITGLQELFSDRYKRIPRMSNYNDRHKAFVLRHSLPVINFIILKYDGAQPDEVLYG